MVVPLGVLESLVECRERSLEPGELCAKGIRLDELLSYLCDGLLPLSSQEHLELDLLLHFSPLAPLLLSLLPLYDLLSLSQGCQQELMLHHAAGQERVARFGTPSGVTNTLLDASGIAYVSSDKVFAS